MNEPESPSTEIIASIQSPDGSRFEVRRVVLPSGTSTGWHYHDGWQTGFLVRGAISHSTADRDSIFEIATPLVEKPDIAHIANSTGDAEAELLFLSHIPAGSEAAVPCPAPGEKASAATPQSGASSVAVPLGKPVFAQAFRYTAMYGPKPFPEALLIYLDNGAYKILSPGEEHYGSYVSATPLGDGMPPQHVSFLSWPSDDWDRNVASHTLTFNVDTGAYIQTLVLPGDPVPHAQAGYALPIDDPTLIDMGASWERVRVSYAEAFERLIEAERARATPR
ncbi:cupin domain-containing protein [Agreia sp. Leaf210]|uniref:cupin domain-containing protein n=1 Tax=Agreia sp. Leaf210 TaxID=1735682 RepID=UPI000ABE5CE1|nr:cupin domain-containing protein [Agreia sp. Leaf210]